MNDALMTETGFVVGVQQSQLIIQVQRQSGCQACQSQKDCGTGAISRFLGQKLVHVTVDNTLNARLGDKVTLAVEEGAVLRGSFWLYALPLLVMMAGIVLLDQLFQTEWLTILSGFSLLLGCYVVLHYNMPAEPIRPTLLTIETQASGSTQPQSWVP